MLAEGINMCKGSEARGKQGRGVQGERFPAGAGSVSRTLELQSSLLALKVQD